MSPFSTSSQMSPLRISATSRQSVLQIRLKNPLISFHFGGPRTHIFPRVLHGFPRVIHGFSTGWEKTMFLLNTGFLQNSTGFHGFSTGFLRVGHPKPEKNHKVSEKMLKIVQKHSSDPPKFYLGLRFSPCSIAKHQCWDADLRANISSALRLQCVVIAH